MTDRPLSSEEQATDQNPMPSTSSNLQSTTTQTLSSNILPGVQTTNQIVISDAALPVAGPSTPQPVNIRPTTSSLTPEDIMPYPKYIPKGKQRQGRKKRRSRILTDTPEKDALIAELKEKKEKKMLAAKRKQEQAEKKK